MTVSINYKNNLSKKSISNLVLFVDEKYNILTLKKHIPGSHYSSVLDLIKSQNLKKKIISIDINSKTKIILVSLKKNLTSSEAENLGAKFYDLFKDIKKTKFKINN